MQELIDYLVSIQAGPITETAELEALLAASWEEFDGGNVEGMAGYKLHGRMEDVVWDPPILRFTIERHGATVLGSTRAERHRWVLNVGKRTANCQNVGHRQVRSMQAKLDVHPIAKEIVQLIIAHKEDERLKWNQDGSVRVRIGEILPEGSAVNQTLTSRRRRFRDTVEELLNEAGWQRVRPNVYTPPTT